MSEGVNTPLVSIIMSCYNAEDYLSAAIESVITQTFRDWELLICDDCSTDNSMKIALRHAAKDKRIRVFKTPYTTGSPARPRNISLNEAKGRFIALLDSDDVWLVDKLEKQIPLFDGKEVAIVFSDYEKIGTDGIRKKRIIRAPKTVKYNSLLYSNSIGNLTAVYDTQLVGKQQYKGIRSEDYLYWLNILSKGYCAKNTCQIMALYREIPDSLSSNKIKSAQWTWNIYSKELKLPLLKCLTCFMVYVIRGTIKFIK